MRLTRDELIYQYPSWNEEKHNIVQAMYGDIPVMIWNREYYERYSTYTGTLSNIMAVDAYMWSQNGDYSVYKPLIGTIYISSSGDVLSGSINVKYRGGTWNIFNNLMYGFQGLSIMRLSGTGKVKGFCNKDGIGSPCSKKNTEEAEPDTIRSVLSVDHSDYGDSISIFIEKCKALYEEDPINHIMNRCFHM